MYVIHEPERLGQFDPDQRPCGPRCAVEEILFQIGEHPVVAEVSNFPRFNELFVGSSKWSMADDLSILNDNAPTNAERIAVFRAWCESRDDIIYIPRESSQRPDGNASLPHGVGLPSEPEATKGIPVHGPVGSTETVGV